MNGSGVKAPTEDKTRVSVRGAMLGLVSGLEPGLRIEVKVYRERLESTLEVDAGLVVLVVNGQIYALVRELADLS